MRIKRFVAWILCLVLCVAMLAGTATAQQQEFAADKQAVMSGLYEADISSMRAAIRQGLITSQELTAYYLDRIEAYNGPYNCFITVCDNAMEVAKQRDAAIANGTGEGLLFGIPIVIKDNMDLAGYHTTNGYSKASSRIAGSNADVVRYLLDEGAVIIAKTNMSTAAQDALRSYSIAVGETKNAYSKSMSAGGSSGGSAVATSLNFAAAALGTDTNSSLRMPAALAGCVSLRPTFGLLSRDGIVKLNGTRDTAGAITRTVYDQALMLDVLTCGKYSYTESLNGDVLDGMRIGVLQELSYATSEDSGRTDANIDDQVANAFSRAISELESCGAEVVPVSMPDIFRLSNRSLVSNSSASKANLYSVFQSMLKQYDVAAVIFPTYLSAPLRSGMDKNGKNWSVYEQVNINNCKALSPSASLPEITVPIGTHSRGAGIGMEIAAARNQEQLLLDIAYAYTSRYDHRTVPGGAPDQYAQSHWGDLTTLVASYEKIVQSNETFAIAGQTVELPNAVHPAENQMLTLSDPDSPGYWIFAVLAVPLILLPAVVVLVVRIRKKGRSPTV